MPRIKAAFKPQERCRADRRISTTALSKIETAYANLHVEDDEPILYAGKNVFGGWLLCSSMDEIYGRHGWRRHLHVPVTFPDLSDFLYQRRTYLDLILESPCVFITEHGGTRHVRTYLISPKEIPRSYLPTKESFCPALSELPPATAAMLLT